jgi:hypothetical protein
MDPSFLRWFYHTLETQTTGWTLSGRRSLETRFSSKIYPFLSKLDSWAMGHQIGWNLDTRVTSTQGTSSQKRFFSNPNILPSDFGWTKKPRFWGNEEKSIKSKGLEPIFTPRLEVDDEAYSSTQIHGRNQRKTPQIVKSKIGPKIPLKISKMKNIAAQHGRWINPKRQLYWCKLRVHKVWKPLKHPPALWKIGKISHFSSLFSKI